MAPLREHEARGAVSYGTSVVLFLQDQAAGVGPTAAGRLADVATSLRAADHPESDLDDVRRALEAVVTVAADEDLHRRIHEDDSAAADFAIVELAVRRGRQDG